MRFASTAMYAVHNLRLWCCWINAMTVRCADTGKNEILLWHSKHIEAETKWPSFSRRHFQMRLFNKMFAFRLIFHWISFRRVQLTISQAPTRRQAIIWTKDGWPAYLIMIVANDQISAWTSATALLARPTETRVSQGWYHGAYCVQRHAFMQTTLPAKTYGRFPPT